MPDRDSDQRSDEETARCRDEVVRRMLATPPKKHEPLKKSREPKEKPK